MWESLSRSTSTVFPFWLDLGIFLKTFFSFFPDIFIKTKYWTSSRVYYVGFSLDEVGESISLTFACRSILTRVLENNLKISFRLFSDIFTIFLPTENNVGRLVTLNLECKRLPHSIFTAFRFGLKFRQTISWHLPDSSFFCSSGNLCRFYLGLGVFFLSWIWCALVLCFPVVKLAWTDVLSWS